MTKITPQTAAIQRAVLLIKDRLAEAAIDEVVSHDELKGMVPEGLAVTHYLLVQRAQRLLNAENGSVFATVRKEGYRRLNNLTGADYASDTAILRIRSQARRGQKVATMAIHFANDATDNDRRRVYQKLASLGMMEYLSMRKSVSTMPDDMPSQWRQQQDMNELRQLINEARKS